MRDECRSKVKNIEILNFLLNIEYFNVISKQLNIISDEYLCGFLKIDCKRSTPNNLEHIRDYLGELQNHEPDNFVLVRPKHLISLKLSQAVANRATFHRSRTQIEENKI